MNKFVTIGYKKDGKAEVIYTSSVSCQKQKALFREIKGNYVLVEIWSRENGLIKKRRMTPEPKKAKSELAKVEVEKIDIPQEVPETSQAETQEDPQTPNLENNENEQR